MACRHHEKAAYHRREKAAYHRREKAAYRHHEKAAYRHRETVYRRRPRDRSPAARSAMVQNAATRSVADQSVADQSVEVRNAAGQNAVDQNAVGRSVGDRSERVLNEVDVSPRLPDLHAQVDGTVAAAPAGRRADRHGTWVDAGNDRHAARDDRLVAVGRSAGIPAVEGVSPLPAVLSQAAA